MVFGVTQPMFLHVTRKIEDCIIKTDSFLSLPCTYDSHAVFFVLAESSVTSPRSKFNCSVKTNVLYNQSIPKQMKTKALLTWLLDAFIDDATIFWMHVKR